MRHLVIAVGRARDDALKALWEEYARRCRPPIGLIEIEERAQLSTAARIRREGEALIAALPARRRLIALDARGLDLPSAEFAQRLDHWRDDGTQVIAYIIGGADGLAREISVMADLVLAFGRATWPHRLVRAMLAEQIYRAESIRAGHPYHRA